MKKQCDCTHSGQDKIHGKGVRIYNPSKAGARCTVCAKTVIVDVVKKVVTTK